MDINFKYPHNLLQLKEYKIAVMEQQEFFFDFLDADDTKHIVRVFKNRNILDDKEYKMEILNNEGILLNLNEPCVEGDVIHLDVLLPLIRNNEYSICISHDFQIECEDNVYEYPFEFDDYSEVTCKLNIIHSSLGFISKDKYIVENNLIKFINISLSKNDKLYIKIIQDGGILLQ